MRWQTPVIHIISYESSRIAINKVDTKYCASYSSPFQFGRQPASRNMRCFPCTAPYLPIFTAKFAGQTIRASIFTRSVLCYCPKYRGSKGSHAIHDISETQRTKHVYQPLSSCTEYQIAPCPSPTDIVSWALLCWRCLRFYPMLVHVL